MAKDVSDAATLARQAVPICGIGASAGGVAALRRFFRELPDNLGLAYVVILHLAPDHRSALSEILSTATAMPVHQVTDSPVLKPNCVYVIPPDRELTIHDDAVEARPFSDERGMRAPIDMFFRSVAACRGDGLAVVLTGTGSDGAIGVKAVKESGGVIFVQEPSEAEFASMPQSAIATGSADFIGPIAELAEHIAEVARSKEAVRSLDSDRAANDLRRIINFLHARTGHDFASYKRSTVMRRVTRRMQVRRMSSLAQYGSYLKETPEEANELLRDLLISVTQFFRDAGPFKALAKKAIPAIFEDVQEDGIRAWVAGCATGEEAYSIAMLILEEAERRKVKIPVQIFATDLDEGALATAREARYPRVIEADVSAERLQRFFIADGSHYRIRQEVRELVLFASHSVLKDPPFLRLDLISCRNLLIYLERSLQERLCATFNYALRPQRFLFLGSAETADAVHDLFAPVDREARIYCSRPRAMDSLPVMPQRHKLSADVIDGPAPPSRAERTATPPVLHENALERLAPASILVDDRHHIVNLSSSAGRYILHSGGPFSGKLDLVVRPELRLDLGHALRKAFEKHEPTLTLPTPVAFNGHKNRVSMNVVPTNTGHDVTPQALVLFLDGGRFEEAEEFSDHADAPPDEFRRLHAELKGVQESLATSRNEHDLAIQELRAANEELQSMNEEYRSTSEELETSKEELQSMNEELQTVNSELKAKLESISTTHNDLRNLTGATEIGTLFLDANLRIRMFTPPMAELFNITDGDIGRPLTDFTHRLVYADIESDLRRVLSELAPVEIELQDAAGHWFMMRVRPYRTIEERIDGVVVTFVDITSRREAELLQQQSETRFRTLFDALNQGFCVIEVIFDDDEKPIDYRFLEVNAVFEEQSGLHDPVGKTIRSLDHQHGDHWFETFGRIAKTQQPERFETPDDGFGGRNFEVYAFPFGQPEKYQIGVLYHDIGDRREAEQERELLTHELSHRVKNTLAVVQGMANQSSREASSFEEFRESFSGRLEALSKAHSLLLATKWQSADLEKLVENALKTYPRDALTVAGPPVRLAPKQGLGLALILHELATNAAKYGALSVPAGRLEVAWSEEAASASRMVRLHWRESKGPAVERPRKKGFGMKLLERACRFELQGTAETKFEPAGFIAEIAFPLN